jgi:putative transposase
MGSQRHSQGVRAKYAFIKTHRNEFDTATMCRVLQVSRSGFYEWLRHPLSERAREDQRLLALIRASYTASHGVYGAPRIFLDLRDAGETCSKHRVERIMWVNKIRALHGYQAPRTVRGAAAQLAPNTLQRQFTVDEPNRAWVTDITYVRTWQGRLYLAVVMDLYSRRIVGWSTKSSLEQDLILDAVLMAVWRRHPKKTLIHSDQGSQYGSDTWHRFCHDHHLEPSVSRHGNCWTTRWRNPSLAA